MVEGRRSYEAIGNQKPLPINGSLTKDLPVYLNLLSVHTYQVQQKH